MIIRKIKPEDNAKVTRIIRKVLVNMKVPKVGTAYADKALENMYENYNMPRAVYFVVEDQDKNILGCAGITQLENYEGNVCELQKMYFLDEARGKGLGTRMMEICLNSARKYGFKSCYIETMPFMKAAQKLYINSGFKYIDKPMGNTGHYSCPVWMLKEL